MKPTIVTLTGPSCAGKTTLEEALIKEGFARVISNTSREPRAGEQDGVQYHFRDNDWFDVGRAMGTFVEVVEFGGNQYGNTEQDIEQAIAAGQGKVAWVVEPKGHKQIQRWAAKNQDKVNLLSVFINASIATISTRFMKRFEEDKGAKPTTYAGRLKMMMSVEREWVKEADDDLRMRRTDQPRLYDMHLDYFDESNDQLAVKLIKEIVEFPDRVRQSRGEGIIYLGR